MHFGWSNFRSHPIWKDGEWFHGVREQLVWLCRCSTIDHLPVVIMLLEGFSPKENPWIRQHKRYEMRVEIEFWFWGYLSDLQTEPPMIHSFVEERIAIWKRNAMKEFDHTSFDDRTIEAESPVLDLVTQISTAGSAPYSFGAKAFNTSLGTNRRRCSSLFSWYQGILVHQYLSNHERHAPQFYSFWREILRNACVHPAQFRGQAVVDGALTDDWIFLKGNNLFPKVDNTTCLISVSIAVSMLPWKNIQVQAGAGSGKTHILVQRIYFCWRWTLLSVEQIGLITFTRDATQEMKKRLITPLMIRLTRQRRFQNGFLKQHKCLFYHPFWTKTDRTLGWGTTTESRFSRSYLMAQRKHTHDFIAQHLSVVRIRWKPNTIFRFIIGKIYWIPWSKIKQKGLSVPTFITLIGELQTDLSQPLISLLSSLFATEAQIRMEKQSDDALNYRI